MTDIGGVPAPWWERSLPPWVDRPDISSFYEMVAALKGYPYNQRTAAVVSQHDDVLVQLCLLVDAIGLDRKSASKFVRLFKLVHSMDEFKNRVVEGNREVATSIANILDVYEDSARIVEIRKSLIPVRKRHPD
ncbi:hypothetical protein NDA18_004531 [Ustilago nuda]|nr:hypothetical protein NDA18_004531 [Ustilago nuda]